tara:strand:- start:15 stop:182 length:168 start_codon:yes stop_codon:yes gene_type:complete
MGTKKGQVRKTARRAYEPKKKKSASRKFSKKKYIAVTYYDVVSGKFRTIQRRRKK